MFRVIEPGILTTIQDAGRWGYQQYGVPVSGAMDLFALRIANQLVGNPPDEAAIEIHSPIALQTAAPHLLALTGAEARFEIGGRALPLWMSIFARAGSLIEIVPQRGWCYLAIHGGIDVPRVLGSKSTYTRGKLGGLAGRALAAGDTIPIGAATCSDLVAAAGRCASARQRAFASHAGAVHVLLGPHADWFAPEALAALTRAEFVVTQDADRMGYRLHGDALPRVRAGELVSCGVPLGAIQVPPDGQPIVLMADHQTTGGYPIIATVRAADLPRVAQRAPGERVRFAVIEIEQAQHPHPSAGRLSPPTRFQPLARDPQTD